MLNIEIGYKDGKKEMVRTSTISANSNFLVYYVGDCLKDGHTESVELKDIEYYSVSEVA